MPTVLIVDDSAVDRRLAGGLLAKAGSLAIDYAENGVAAIEHMRRSLPDLVLSDLQMPEMDGLELVEAVRARWPLVPVVLMTAYGSEDIAVEALRRGAASYVPKSNLARELLDTIDNVLAVARADRRTENLMNCLVRSEAHFELSNDPVLLPAMVDHLQDYVTRMRLCDETDRIRVGIALEEALLNALYHGNLELTTQQLRESSESLLEADAPDLVEERCRTSPFCDRKIYVSVYLKPGEVEYVIRDEGPGFEPDLQEEPTDLMKSDGDGRRGLMLMRTFMNDVRFNDLGNEIHLFKRAELPSREPRSKSA